LSDVLAVKWYGGGEVVSQASKLELGSNADIFGFNVSLLRLSRNVVGMYNLRWSSRRFAEGEAKVRSRMEFYSSRYGAQLNR
jgi:hypothetical protein